jgi:hypothetical protein
LPEAVLNFYFIGSFNLTARQNIRSARHALVCFALLTSLFAACQIFARAASERTSSERLDLSTSALSNQNPYEPAPLEIEGENANDVFGIGRTVIVRGNVQRGVMALGGDCIVEGRVEGDVAAIGGSVIQRENSYIGGDVLVFGGAYHHGKTVPQRSAQSKTIMFAGYEQELREMFRQPTTLLTPHWTPAAVGLRLFSVLCWFLLSLLFVTAIPNAVSRAAVRLQLTSLHVAAIGLLGAIVAGIGVPAALKLLPPMFGFVVSGFALLVLLVSYLFGRVVIQAATGRWLQRLIFSEERRSESIALLIGALFWGVILSLPYVWVFAVTGILVVSLGLALTARLRRDWSFSPRLNGNS